MITRMIIAFCGCAALTVVPAVIEGRYVNRWGAPADFTSAAARLKSLPAVFGSWEFIDENAPLSPAIIEELGVVEHVNRIYRHKETGETVGVLLMMGVPGKLLRHPPDICYANRGNREVDNQNLDISNSQVNHRFRLLTYETAAAPTAEQLRVAYAYSDNGTWDVPTSPRMRYGGADLLYKIQVIRTEAVAESEPGSVTKSFLQAFTGEFARQLKADANALNSNPSEQP